MRTEVSCSKIPQRRAWILGARLSWTLEDSRFDAVVLVADGLPTAAMLAPRLSGTVAEIEALGWVAEIVTSGVVGFHSWPLHPRCPPG